MLAIAEELQLLPSLEAVRWWKLDERITNAYIDAFQLLAQEMAKIRNLKEIRLPQIYTSPNGLLDLLNQQLSIISIIPYDSFPTWYQWLERHRHGLRELNITIKVRRFRFVLSTCINSNSHHLPSHWVIILMISKSSRYQPLWPTSLNLWQ